MASRIWIGVGKHVWCLHIISYNYIQYIYIYTCLFERWLNFCLFVNKYFIPQNDVFWVPTAFFKFSTFWIRFQFLIIFGHAHPSTATWMKPFPAGMQWVKGAIQHVHHNIVLGQSDQPHKMWMNAVEETNNANLFRSQAFSFNSGNQWFHPWSFWLESGRGRLLVDLQCWRLQSCAGAPSPLCRLHWIGIGEQGGGCKFATNILYFETWFCGNLSVHHCMCRVAKAWSVLIRRSRELRLPSWPTRDLPVSCPT